MSGNGVSGYAGGMRAGGVTVFAGDAAAVAMRWPLRTYARTFDPCTATHGRGAWKC